MIAVSILSGWVNYLTIIAIIPLAIVFIVLRKRFMINYRTLKRLEAECRIYNVLIKNKFLNYILVENTQIEDLY